MHFLRGAAPSGALGRPLATIVHMNLHLCYEFGIAKPTDDVKSASTVADRGFGRMDEKRANLITLIALSLDLARDAGEVTVEELRIAALEEACSPAEQDALGDFPLLEGVECPIH